jgi:hypothetical protein
MISLICIHIVVYTCCFFLLLNSVVSYNLNIIGLQSRPLMDIWIFSSFCLLRIKLPWRYLYMSFFTGMCSNFSSIHIYERNIKHIVFNFKGILFSFMATVFKAKIKYFKNLRSYWFQPNGQESTQNSKYKFYAPRWKFKWRLRNYKPQLRLFLLDLHCLE